MRPPPAPALRFQTLCKIHMRVRANILQIFAACGLTRLDGG